MDTFGDRLRASRTRLGMTQDEVAELVGVTKAAVSAWENNREHPGFDKLPKLRAAVETSLDDLVCGDAAAAELARQQKAIAEGKNPYPNDGRELYPVTPEQRKLLNRWEKQAPTKRRALLTLME